MIPVCYSCNGKIFEGVALSLLSAARRTAEPLCAYVLTMDLSDRNPDFFPVTESQRAALEKMIKAYHADSRVVLYDLRELYLKTLAMGKNKNNSYTPYTLLRLYLDELDVPAKLLYLDIDTMLAGDVKGLYDIDVTGCEFAAVRDHMGRFFISDEYVNAGVLLLNLDEIRRTKLFVKAREMVKNRRMIMADQSALNKYAENKKFIPRRYNEQRKMKSDTVVKHFCKGIRFFPLFFYIYNIKQWQRDAVHKKLKIFRFDEDYAAYDKLLRTDPLFAAAAAEAKKAVTPPVRRSFPAWPRRSHRRDP